MAQTQYQTMDLPQRLPLAIAPGNRNSSTSKDARLVNCYVETDPSGDLEVYKRPGLAVALATTPAPGQGVFFWRGDVYAIVNGTLYKNGAVVAGTVGMLNQLNGVYRFNEILGGNPKMIFSNGLKTYTYNTTDGLIGPLDTVDPNFPATTVKGIAYLNGTTYVMTPDAEVRGSLIDNVDSPTSWNVLNLILARTEPDPGIYLAKQNVYVVALGSWSIDPFYDAGNTQGSPLRITEGIVVKYGCQNADSVQEIDDRLFWLSTGQNATMQVSMLDNMNHSIISTPEMDRLLYDADAGTVASWKVKLNGHNFYVLTIRNLNLTLAYDIKENLWCQWTDENGNYMPISASSYDSQKRLIVQHESNGNLYYMGSQYFTDAGTVIPVDIITPNFDAETKRKKYLSELGFLGDQYPGNFIEVRCSDDDYQTWTNYRRVELNRKNPSLSGCGTFKRRAYHIRHRLDAPLRLSALDAQYDIGTL